MSRHERHRARGMWAAVSYAATLLCLSGGVLYAQETSVIPKAADNPLAAPYGQPDPPKPARVPAPARAVVPAVPQLAAEGTGGGIPELVPVESAEAIRQVWRDMRRAYNKHSFMEVCQAFDTLSKLGQDINPSSATAGYAYLQCARRRAMSGDLAAAEEYLRLSIRYGREVKHHDSVRAIIDRDRGMEALSQGDLESALRLLELANARGPDVSANEVVSAALTRYAFEMHGRDDDVRSLAALDAALLFYPGNRQAEILRRDIWMWDYGAWIVVALIVFLLAIYAVFRQYREVKFRETVNRGY